MNNTNSEDPVIIYLQECIAEDVKMDKPEQLEIDKALLDSYRKGYLSAKFENGEWLFQGTDSGMEAYLIHIAGQLSQGQIVAEA